MVEFFRGTVRESWAPMVVKVLKADLVAYSEVVGRFVRERSILTSISHPNVVTVPRVLILELTEASADWCWNRSTQLTASGSAPGCQPSPVFRSCAARSSATDRSPPCKCRNWPNHRQFLTSQARTGPTGKRGSSVEQPLGSKYLLHEALGRGAMGQVFAGPSGTQVTRWRSGTKARARVRPRGRGAVHAGTADPNLDQGPERGAGHRPGGRGRNARHRHGADPGPGPTPLPAGPARPCAQPRRSGC